jgi:hypothetical protein
MAKNSSRYSPNSRNHWRFRRFVHKKSIDLLDFRAHTAITFFGVKGGEHDPESVLWLARVRLGDDKLRANY